MDDVFEEMFQHLKRVGVYDEVVGEFSAGAREAPGMPRRSASPFATRRQDGEELGDEGDALATRGMNGYVERMRGRFAGSSMMEATRGGHGGPPHRRI